MPAKDKFDPILYFDVFKHVLDPSQQLLEFYKTFNSEGKMIGNWYFFKGFNQEYPFNLDDPKVVEIFFHTLQSHCLEVFHPYLITTRCYRKQS